MSNSNLKQILKLTKINLKISIKSRFNLVITYIIFPLVTFFFCFITILPLMYIFNFTINFGPWTAYNSYLIMFIGIIVILLQVVIVKIQVLFNNEKYMDTISSLVESPLHRVNLLLGIVFSHLILIFIPFTIFFSLVYIYYPISFITIIVFSILLLAIFVIFIALGLIVGISSFSSSSKLVKIIPTICIFMIIFLSWKSYADFYFTPDSIQALIILNPFYYVFDFLSLVWIEDGIFDTIRRHGFSLFILVILLIIAIIVIIFIGRKSLNLSV